MATEGEEKGTYIRKTVEKIDGVMKVVKVEVVKLSKPQKSPRQQRYSS